ncbi:hypothetical protein GE09DRAFT_1210398 [Coniochaeta sp. 2T2.1]|nr:hypothetical protein GE09DRAFT_1210398 [Coniochaeta sp. 2T2.1]
MSANTPESIPTSSDPRSKRPTKKRALSPTSLQAATLSTLFSKPDQEIRLPPPLSSSSSTSGSLVAKRAVPEIVTNVQGSSAGAGSGEFHVYKASRRREYERLRVMDEEVQEEKDREEFERGRKEREMRDEEKTRRNRERRERKKGKRGGNGKGGEKGAEAGKVGKVLPRTVGEGRDEDMADGDGEGQERDGGQPAVVASGPGLVIHDDD